MSREVEPMCRVIETLKNCGFTERWLRAEVAKKKFVVEWLEAIEESFGNYGKERWELGSD